MQEGLISIIVPVYKAEKYIHRCVDSLINQTYNDLEIILVDDGSPDNSGMICDEYAKKDNRIKVIHKENGGVSSARNIGLEKATGEYIAFVDSDDWVELDMYEELLDKMKKYDVDIVRCAMCRDDTIKAIDLDFGYEESVKLDLKKNRIEFLSIFMNGQIGPCIVCLLIKKKFIDKNLKFDSNFALGEDLLFWIELVCKINTIYLYRKMFYHYYVNSDSATIAPEYRKRNINNLIILNSGMNDILKKHRYLDEKLKEDFAFYCFYNMYIRLARVVSVDKNFEFLLQIIEEEKTKSLISNLNLKDKSMVAKLFYYLIKNKKKRILYCYCILFEFFKGIQNRNSQY